MAVGHARSPDERKNCDRNAKATYRNLHTWQAAMRLAEACYRETARFPREERYGLRQQIRNAAASIPSNIAEGHCRKTTRAYLNFLHIAAGSHGELETRIELARRLSFLEDTAALRLTTQAAEVGRLLTALTQAIRAKVQASEARAEDPRPEPPDPIPP